MSRYDQQIFIVLSPRHQDDNMIIPIADKWNQQHQNGFKILYVETNFNAKRYIDGKKYFNYIVDFEQWHKAFSQVTPKTRIYIIAHHRYGLNVIASDALLGDIRIALSYEELAIYFNMFMPKHVCSPEAVLHINLLACEAGGKVTVASTSENPALPINNSFAAKLSHCLKESYNISIPVVARTGAVCSSVYGFLPNISKKPVCLDYEAQGRYNIMFNIYKQWYKEKLIDSQQFTNLMQLENSRFVEKFAPKNHPFSKVVYKYNDAGQQVCLDAYSNWREL